MRFVKASPSEFLLVSRNGEVRNLGTAACALVWPGSSWVLIPSTKQEATFEMTQETRDGIPLRFKGIIVYHVEDPVAAARVFDFSCGQGHREIQGLLSHISLGELRSVAAQMTMVECVGQRKTTLTDAVTKALQDVIVGAGPAGRGRSQPWGSALDVVQVAQVFVVDVELRRQLEAEVRTAIRSTSDLAEIAACEKVKVAEITSGRAVQREGLESEKQRVEIDTEKARLKKRLELEEMEADAPVRLARIAQQAEVARHEMELKRLELSLRELEVELALVRPKAEQAMRLEILPVEQTPEIARALSGVLKGANLSVVGSDQSSLISTLAPLVEYLVGALARASGRAGAAPGSDPTSDEE
ncbi:MAG: hypothetical protein HY815_33200 [Candidatus Riflebacteria bacterium]|nr:hypothetical protein [Candidatus Riflebacteria bacterium]